VNTAQARVLQVLRSRSGASCSGADLSRELGVSRAQVWKHVEALRQLGYRISGAPGEGYRFQGAPDRLYPVELERRLRTRWLAREIHYFEQIDSTNRVAEELGQAGARHGTTVVAEAQSAGRGRLGRSFFSPPRQNLYTSILLRPALALADAPSLVLAAAVAVAEAVIGTLGEREAVEIKWSNDVLIRARKTSGILMELSAEADRVGSLVLGIGVNLNVPREALPPEFRERATSVASERGRPVDRVGFATALYGTLEQMLDLHATQGFEALRPHFEALFRMAGRPIRVADLTGRETRGIAEGVDPDGALRLRCGPGVRRVLAGDVTLDPESTP